MHFDGAHLFGDVLARALYQPLAQVGVELRPGIGGDVDAASQRASHVGGDLPDGVCLLYTSMTGSRDFIDMGNGLRMSLTRNKTSANRLDIIYDARCV